MRTLAIWTRVTWFYLNGILVVILKSEKGRYQYEIFTNHVIMSSGYPFKTELGATNAAKDEITENKDLENYGDWKNNKA